MSNYFRLTGYCKEHDFCFIIDCVGKFEKMWQFSSYLVNKGLHVLEISNGDKFLDGNIPKTQEDKDHILLRANANGKPETISQTINGVTYKAIKVADKIYIPNKEERI